MVKSRKSIPEKKADPDDPGDTAFSNHSGNSAEPEAAGGAETAESGVAGSHAMFNH
jgi:hypothetical protein